MDLLLPSKFMSDGFAVFAGKSVNLRRLKSEFNRNLLKKQDTKIN